MLGMTGRIITCIADLYLWRSTPTVQRALSAFDWMAFSDAHFLPDELRLVYQRMITPKEKIQFIIEIEAWCQRRCTAHCRSLFGCPRRAMSCRWADSLLSETLKNQTKKGHCEWINVRGDLTNLKSQLEIVHHARWWKRSPIHLVDIWHACWDGVKVTA